MVSTASEKANAARATARSISRFLRPIPGAGLARPDAIREATIASSLATAVRHGIAPAEDARPPTGGRGGSSPRASWPE